MPDYVIANKAPPGGADKGAGAWCSAPQTAEFLVYKRTLQMALDTHALELTMGPDAVAHMRHFMNNTGRDYQLNMPELMGKSAQLKKRADEELALAKTFSETLGPGRYSLSSAKRGHGYFRQSEDNNLFFAIGGYAYWGQGELLVEEIFEKSAPRPRHYTLDFEFHFYDRYNWDAGKAVNIVGIEVTDSFMQNFHRQCYAREFDIKGQTKQRLSWDAGATFASLSSPKAAKPAR
jgi:hypothetical protein